MALRSAVLWRIVGIGACYVYSIAFFQSWLQFEEDASLAGTAAEAAV